MKKMIMIIALMGLMAVYGCSKEASDEQLTAETADKSEVTLASDNKVIVCDVKGMTCTGCETGVEMAVKKLDGVIKVNASFADGTAEVTVDPEKVSEQEVIDAINKSGFKAEKKDPGTSD